MYLPIEHALHMLLTLFDMILMEEKKILPQDSQVNLSLFSVIVFFYTFLSKLLSNKSSTRTPRGVFTLIKALTAARKPFSIERV